jgi:TRAP-type uncharacterized transport system substrate-binding protein
MRFITTLALLLALPLFCTPATARPRAEIDMVMPALQLDQAIAQQIADLVSEESRLKINLVPLPDESMSELDALESGYADIAFSLNNAEFRDAISTVMPLYPSVLQVLADADRPAGSLHEFLADAVIMAGPKGSVSRTRIEQLIGGLELTGVDVRFADSIDDGPNVIVVYAPIDRQRLIHDPLLRGMKMFSFGDPAEIGLGSPVDRAVLLNPRLRPFVIPVGTFGDLTPEPVLTVAVDTLLVARSDMDSAVIYDLYQEMLRLRPALFSARPELFQPIDENITQANFAFSWHPGALAFLKRDEPALIERYSGVAEVVVTLMVAVVSAGFALIRIYHVRRKNRLDKVLVKVIDIRNSVTPETSSAERAEAIARIRALQDYGFEQLVNEKLAADESFRIFIELTNDSIEYLQKPGLQA